MKMDEKFKNVAVIIEISNSIKYLRNGLAEIQRINASNDFYDPPLIYLSGGLERLFKSMICMNYKEVHGRHPNYQELMQNHNGHDIEFLKAQIEKLSVPIELPFAAKDYDIITKDELINQICKTLSEYAQKARYFNLDAILGRKQEFDAKNEWEGIETAVLKDFYGDKELFKMLKVPSKLDELYKKSSELLVVRIEQFLRAIARQFIFGTFSKDSKMFLFDISVFSDIDDNQLGQTDYRKYQPNERIKRR